MVAFTSSKPLINNVRISESPGKIQNRLPSEYKFSVLSLHQLDH